VLQTINAKARNRYYGLELSGPIIISTRFLRQNARTFLRVDDSEDQSTVMQAATLQVRTQQKNHRLEKHSDEETPMPELPEVERMCRGIHSIISQPRFVTDRTNRPAIAGAVSDEPDIQRCPHDCNTKTSPRIEAARQRVDDPFRNRDELVIEPRHDGLVLLADPGRSITAMRSTFRFSTQLLPSNSSTVPPHRVTSSGPSRPRYHPINERRVRQRQFWGPPQPPPGPPGREKKKGALSLAAEPTLRNRTRRSARASRCDVLRSNASWRDPGNPLRGEICSVAGIDPQTSAKKSHVHQVDSAWHAAFTTSSTKRSRTKAYAERWQPYRKRLETFPAAYQTCNSRLRREDGTVHSPS